MHLVPEIPEEIQHVGQFKAAIHVIHKVQRHKDFYFNVCIYCQCEYYTVLYYIILYYTIEYNTILYSTILYCTVLYCTVLYLILYCTGTVLYCTVLYCTVLYRTVPYRTVPYRTHLLQVSAVFGRLQVDYATTHTENNMDAQACRICCYIM